MCGWAIVDLLFFGIEKYFSIVFVCVCIILSYLDLLLTCIAMQYVQLHIWADPQKITETIRMLHC